MDTEHPGQSLRTQAALWLKLLVDKNWGNEEGVPGGLTGENKENIIGGIDASAY